MLDPTEDEAYQENGGLLLAYMPQASLVGPFQMHGIHVLHPSVEACSVAELAADVQALALWWYLWEMSRIANHKSIIHFSLLKLEDL